MKRIIRNLITHPTSDGRLHARTFGDEILHAVAPGKVLVSSLTWRGDLQPVLDSYMEQLKPLENGLMLGRVLHAEEIGHVLDSGRLWMGNLATKLLAAAADFATAERPEEAGEEPGTDVTEVLGQLDRLRRDMGTSDRARIADGMRRLRDAGARVTDSLRGRPTGDSGGLMHRTRIGNFSKPQTVTSINARNADFWRSRSVTTVDSRPTTDVPRQTALRDAAHAQAHATTPAARLRAMNDAARAFWPSTAAAPAAPIGRQAAPVGRMAADINAANRAFWAGRS